MYNFQNYQALRQQLEITAEGTSLVWDDRVYNLIDNMQLIGIINLYVKEESQFNIFNISIELY